MDFSENASPLPGRWASGPQARGGIGTSVSNGEGRALLSWEAAQALRGGHPTLVIPVRLSFCGDSFHFRPGISREAFTTLGLKLSHVLTASMDYRFTLPKAGVAPSTEPGLT